MRRFKQQVSEAECIRILQEEKRGVLSVLGEDGYPYGIPMNHWYNPEDGKIYFHGAKTGHKIDAIARCDKVSFCVWDAGYRKEGEWALNISSVIVFGKMRVVSDPEEAKDIYKKLSLKFTEDVEYIDAEIRKLASVTVCYELQPEHITGKIVNEA
jgi:nitroimidazol reductase NimA-like FMN-containing flavoprotein (pyridoxamine 5'-phosphate oxidase superfamily)